MRIIFIALLLAGCANQGYRQEPVYNDQIPIYSQSDMEKKAFWDSLRPTYQPAYPTYPTYPTYQSHPRTMRSTQCDPDGFGGFSCYSY